MGQSQTGRRKTAGAPSRISEHVRAPRGADLQCHGWSQEAALRMLMNSLDPNVAEQPGDLIACSATRKVLRDWESYAAIVNSLRSLKDDETLLVQSGKSAGVIKTHPEAPRVLIVNPGPAPRHAISAGPEESGITLPSQASAASWTWVGAQEALPTAFLVFDAIARKYFGGNLAGKLIVSGGMGAAGGALALAAGMHHAAFLGIEVDGERIRRRIRAGYCDYCVNTLDEALRILKNAVRQKQGISVGLVGNCAEIIPDLATRGVLPDVLTDQTSAHDLLHGYFPSGLNAQDAGVLRKENPQEYLSRCRDSIARHFSGMLALEKMGSIVFEFGNDLCAAAAECGASGAASAFPDFIEAYLRPLLAAGLAPVRWVALSGDAGDIKTLDTLAIELFPDDALLARWVPLARKFVRFQGLPARVLWMDQRTRILLAERVNSLVAQGAFKAPLVIAVDQASESMNTPHLAGPGNQMKKSNATAPLPALNRLLSAEPGASWLSSEVCASFSQVTVALAADGSPQTAKKIHRALGGDYALKILRLAATAVE
ncbi:MAG TPA: urocanate hydratase [Terriglobia bacterium]|nr:urocanate hydratase [Terriglobia bacterium]